MAHPKPVHPSAEALKQGYEPDGVHFWTLVGILMGIALVIAVFMGVAAWMILVVTRHDRAAEVSPSDVPVVPVNTGLPPLPSLPPLQPSPAHDRTAAEDFILLRQHEDDVFAQMGWQMGADRNRQVPDEILKSVAAKQKAAANGGR